MVTRMCVFLQQALCVCLCVSVHPSVPAVVSEREACVSLPPGLLVVEDYVTPEEETVLLDAIDWSSHDDDVTGEELDLKCNGSHMTVTFGCI